MPITGTPVEIVERKGQGHPDSICDALAETASLALCRLYRERFGRILHHNVDKILLCGGEAQPAFGGGRVIRPIEIFLAGRATHCVGGLALPIDETVMEACKTWLRANLVHLDLAQHARLHLLLRPSSADLVSLFPERPEADAILANDTSCGVGFAPLTPLENAVYEVERHLNGATFKAGHPEIGEHIKVMGVRQDDEVRLTIAVAFVGAHLVDANDYLAKKEYLGEAARTVAGLTLDCPVSVEINTADRPPDNLYLTVTGTSAEAGDDGEAGRGNRANGLITPYRPMTIESVAGKNPVNHVGKLYNLAAGLIADELVRQLPGLSGAECRLVSQIGRPIGEPLVVDIRVRSADGTLPTTFRAGIAEIATASLSRLDGFADELLAGELAFDRWPLRKPATDFQG